MEHIKIINQQKTFFDSGRTRDLSYIKDKLKALKTNILSNEEAIYEALYNDFKKSRFEAYFSEIGIVVAWTIIRKRNKPHRICNGIQCKQGRAGLPAPKPKCFM